MPLSDAHIQARINASSRAILSLAAQRPALLRICEVVEQCVRSGSKVMTCGNGGSAAEALHLAEELIGKYRSARPPLPAICLNADPTALTCIANDFGFEHVFARQIAALARPGDVLVAFSTSGKSANIVRALQAAKPAGVHTIGLLGRDGGPCRELCELALIVESDDTAHIQEAHQVILHLILESVESA